MMNIAYQSGFRRIAGHNIFFSEYIPEHAHGSVVLCSPFLEEKLFCRRFLRNLAEAICALGWRVIRFDHCGEGDSEGDLTENDLNDARENIAAMVAAMRDQCDGPCVIIGLRWGATLALLTESLCDGVIAIEPMQKGEDYLQQLLRQSLTTQMATWGAVRHNREALLESSKRGGLINIQGFDLGPRLISQMRMVELSSQAPSEKVAIIRLGREEGEPPVLWQSLVSDWNASYYQVEERPFWYEPKFYDPRRRVLSDAVCLQMGEWFQ